MEIGDFAEIMFTKNENNYPVLINFEGIENNKDLFLCFMDLFCKGLILCYGNGNRTINFDDLDLEKFKYIQTKMMNSGIVIHMNVVPVDYELPTSINSNEIESQPDDLSLESYHFKIYNKFYIYDISFELNRI
jgi:hypothetical protein